MRFSTNLTCTVLLAVLPGLAAAQTAIEEVRDVARGGTVTIENISGSVVLGEWSEAKVKVMGTLGRGAKRLDFDVHNGRTTIRVVVPDNSRRVDGSDLEILVPTGTRVGVETVNAGISANDSSGRLELESVSGDIALKGCSGELELASVSGDITVDFAASGSTFESVSGSILILDASGTLDVETVSGSVEVTAPDLEGGDFATVSGRIAVTTDLKGNGSFDLESVSGSVSMTVPRGAAASFKLSTFSGRIRNQIGPQAERTSQYTPGEEARFSVGSGGPRVDMSCFSGTVKLMVE